MKHRMKFVLGLVLAGGLGLAAVGCTTVAGKAATHKAKMITPGVDAKGEKAIKGARNLGDGDKDGVGRRRDEPAAPAIR